MLTDAKIKGIKPAITKKRYTDGLNLSLIVEPKGRKYFEIRYKSPVTKTIRSYSAGTYPYVSLQDARKKAMEIKEAVANGIDIKDKEKTFKFRDIAIEYLNLKNGRVTQKHLNRCLRCMENYIYPTLGNMDIKDITANMLITSLKPLEQNEKLDTLHRALSIAKEIFRYAHMRGYIHTNQIADISANTVFKTYKQKNYPSLTNLDDLKGLIASIQAYNGDIKTKVALKLSLLTANRPYNIRAAKWQEIDLENEIWTILAEKMKGKIEHILPLSKQVVELLKEYRKIDFGSEFLFP
ncbi:tyrosine-type recombinase/integrase [Campylobacter sputorum]|uniref:tyrosine-type recombinase/integrase n=1 Tax=Campylobacter sputorum TaxID=206 RepID=UPI00053BE279|nr:integrase arm-type DNA-binding domain-containing protein [Campylobacter sputorum]